ncbi:MAG: SDR family NAD(P)-dependent oxidoreductase [Spirochaetia bacterium]|nr:SDR family NAD(P)-dependent oxidoreductase [Spirochaetia bacterium]
MRISGNTFLVTGGSSGLGQACVQELARRDGRIVIADLAAPGSSPKEALFVGTDITNPDSVQHCVDAAVQHFGALRGVVNCAGIGTVVNVMSKKKFGALEPFRKTIEVNLMGTFNVLSIAASAMRDADPDEEGERGVIINTASVAAFDGQIGQSAYSASKGAVASMTLPLSRELAKLGIRVMAIAPGTFETPMIARLPEKSAEALRADIPFPQRFGRPEEFAALALHIFENRYLNGQVIRLDAGLRMG